MENLSGHRLLNLTPSSMQGGNTVADDGGLTLSGPGSPSVLPVPDAMNVLPQPQIGGHEPMVVTGPALTDHATRADGHPDQGTGHGWQAMEEAQGVRGSIHDNGTGGWKQV